MKIKDLLAQGCTEESELVPLVRGPGGQTTVALAGVQWVTAGLPGAPRKALAQLTLAHPAGREADAEEQRLRHIAENCDRYRMGNGRPEVIPDEQYILDPSTGALYHSGVCAEDGKAGLPWMCVGLFLDLATGPWPALPPPKAKAPPKPVPARPAILDKLTAAAMRDASKAAAGAAIPPEIPQTQGRARTVKADEPTAEMERQRKDTATATATPSGKDG